MKKLYFLAVTFLLTTFAIAQCNGRYQTEIFSNTNVATVDYSDVYTGLEHRMDIYTATGDTVSDRPVIFYLHGGSFYSGDKSMTDCVDFCNAFAKRGYVAVSLNYRLANIITFLSSNNEQYKAVLKAVADLKAGIRFIRKDYVNGDPYAIDPNTIFIGGYSAGAVAALHTAFIDSISDLSATIQALMPTIGGTLEGDAGNDGLDFMSSNIKVDNYTINKCGDKGMSLGENSKITGSNIKINDCYIGIASKDRSIGSFDDVSIANSIIGLSSYVKNWRYGVPGIIEIKKKKFVKRRS